MSGFLTGLILGNMIGSANTDARTFSFSSSGPRRNYGVSNQMIRLLVNNQKKAREAYSLLQSKVKEKLDEERKMVMQNLADVDQKRNVKRSEYEELLKQINDMGFHAVKRENTYFNPSYSAHLYWFFGEVEGKYVKREEILSSDNFFQKQYDYLVKEFKNANDGSMNYEEGLATLDKQIKREKIKSFFFVGDGEVLALEAKRAKLVKAYKDMESGKTKLEIAGQLTNEQKNVIIQFVEVCDQIEDICKQEAGLKDDQISINKIKIQSKLKNNEARLFERAMATAIGEMSNEDMQAIQEFILGFANEYVNNRAVYDNIEVSSAQKTDSFDDLILTTAVVEPILARIEAMENEDISEA